MIRTYALIDANGRATAFYNDQLHAPRRITVVEPGFDPALDRDGGDWPAVEVPDPVFDPRPQPIGHWPTVAAPNPGFEPEQPEGPENLAMVDVKDPAFVPPTKWVRDESFVPPQVEIDNPKTRIPAAAFEIDQATYEAWITDTGNQLWDAAANGGAGGLAARVISLEELRSQKILAVQALHEKNAVPGSISIDVGGGRLIPVDIRGDRDFRNIQGLVTAAQVSAGPFQFRGADDQIYALSNTEMTALGLSVQSHVSAVYAAAWIHKDALADLTDKPSVEAYDITTGWPSP